MQKVVVIPSNGIGNFLLSIPLIEKLSHNYKVDLVLNSINKKLAINTIPHLINEIVDLDQSFIKLIFALKKRKYFSSYYCFPAHRNKYLLSLYLSKIKHRYGYKLNGKGIRLNFLHPSLTPISHILNEAVMNLKLYDKTITKTYIITNRDKYYFKNIPKSDRENRICVHLGAGSQGSLGELKLWPIDRWNQLLKLLNDIEIIDEISVLIGPSEKHALDKIIDLPKINFIQTDLVNLVDFLAHSIAFVGNDNGVAHLAAFCAIPVYTLFGPSNQYKNHPLFNEHNIITSNIHCSPCQKLIGETY